MNYKYFQIAFYAVRAFYPSCNVTASLPLAQAVLESRNFTSDVYQRAHNFFGMTFPSKRDTVAIGKDGKYCKYANDLDCIRDYFKWLSYWKIYSDAQLLEFLKKSYAEDSQYLVKVRNILPGIQGQLLDPATLSLYAVGAGVAAIAALRAS
ncbi:hypothetical protein F0P96_04415 [Hymenobacter busanensis]|uniref:Uncharacterized protein n=1 Tax=Hymenobacter busanensis TaxID=2607656 RepID=A0A7L4ZSR1_9BACT|nr:glucosaminidase domain-containing protein [Hymenobacter busanensis]KAA9339866.1 hypothetical protein F0P96_04415 [Hymenobacter busanensis]QHJ06379.1 hypothetical protein GUY19_03320 [Hymenobacter busanensis]